MAESLLEVQGLKKYFPIKLGLLKSLTSEAPLVRAVDGVSFKISAGEVFGLVGESGCGKTTTGRCILRLIEPTGGRIVYKGEDITNLPLEREMRRLRRSMQIIFQDPYESLNPRMSIYDIIAEPIRLQKITENSEETLEMVKRALEEMRMVPPDEYLYRFPHELSGGQRQRVAVARAFVLEPDFIVADEPTSMLDASIRGEVLKLILNLIEKTRCAFLYITHDFALARYTCDRIAVMYLGQIVEKALTEEVIKNPAHPYTEALLAAVPVPDPTARRTEVVVKGEVPSPINPPQGCRFHPRCPYAKKICSKEEPKLVEVGNNHYVACYFPINT
jgi:peptide/nickel transport system ATP-binding protein